MENTREWDLARLQRLISDEIEESLTIEYKSAAALEKSDGKRKELTKDVSAMANSAGGVIIYGIKEFDEKEKRHLPERIDPIDRTIISKEWLEQVIGNIQPRIPNFRIFPIPAIEERPTTKVVYVVEIEPSVTPHQATDKRYYRRYNFENQVMADYEINDIRNRRFDVETLVNFEIEIEQGNIILFIVENTGSVAATEVAFSFSSEPAWGDHPKPPVFEKGIAFFPPGRKYSFFYREFIGLLDDESVPSSFNVNVSYFHPRVGRRIEDVFVVDFSDFSRSLVVKTELEEVAEKVIKELRDLTSQLKNIHKDLGELLNIAGPSGLQLSNSTLRNLQHIVNHETHQEKLDPELYPLNANVFREVLGINPDLAFRIAHYFRWPEDKVLRDIEGMTEEIYGKLELLFQLETHDE